MNDDQNGGSRSTFESEIIARLEGGGPGKTGDPAGAPTRGASTDGDLMEEVLTGEPEDVVERLIRDAIPPEDGRCSLGEEIASGGGGSVSFAYDHTLRRRMAVKVLHPQSISNPLLVRYFLREAQITAQLDHPYIVPIHEMRQEGGYPYFTMSLVKGKDLKDWMKSRPLVDFATLVDFLEIMSKVCDALEFAHTRGVVHCDLKAQNIMVGDVGQVYLMDWGGAELRYTSEMLDPDREPPIRDTLPRLPAEETEGKIFGTLSYIAPERAQGERPDARSDVFSMGGLIYAFLKGKAPFEAEHAAESFELARNCRYDPIDERAHAGVVPRGLYGIIRKAMAPDPGDRYPSVAALKDDLNNILRGGGTFPAVKVKEGEVIIREGDQGDAAYIVVRGRLQVYREAGGERVNLRVLDQGEVFGEMAILTSSPRTASVAALTDATLIKITDDVILQELDSMKPWMAAFVSTLAHRFLEREIRDHKAEAKGAKSRKSWWTRR